MSIRTNGTHPYSLLPGTKLLGEVITWSCTGLRIAYSDLIEALRESSLDESVARELAPRHAFARACRKLSERRIIRAVGEDQDTLRFQFTAEEKDGDRYTYALETMLTLDKSSGKIRCDLPGLAMLAQEHLDACMSHRNGGDLTRLIQRLFERHADLFAIRDRGGCYFCPARHASFVDQIDTFLTRLKGNLRRFPVPAGTPQGDRSVKEAVTSGLETLIQEHRSAIACFGEDTRPDTLKRAAERIQQTRVKIMGYAEYLAEERTRLERDLSATQAFLREKIESLSLTPA